MSRRALGPLAILGLAAGCATKGQVRLLEGTVQTLRVETARRDSARAAALAAVIGLQRQILDSLTAGREALRTLEVRLGADMTEVQRQLLQVQELTGQSQRRLSELKGQLDQRAEQSAAAGTPRIPAPADTAARSPVAPPAAPPSASADQMYQGAVQLVFRGSLVTARGSFQEFLRSYPTHAQVPDAIYYIGETFAVAAPDSAVAYYDQVVSRFPRSARAPTALYKLGRLEEARGNVPAARNYYDRVLKEYPRSDDADVVRDRLKNLRP